MRYTSNYCIKWYQITKQKKKEKKLLGENQYTQPIVPITALYTGKIPNNNNSNYFDY